MPQSNYNFRYSILLDYHFALAFLECWYFAKQEEEKNVDTVKLRLNAYPLMHSVIDFVFNEPHKMFLSNQIVDVVFKRNNGKMRN